MRITVSRARLAEATGWAYRGIGTRPAVPVLAGMRAAIMGEELTLATFDYEVTTLAHAAGSDTADGTVLVSGQLLRNVVRALPPGRTIPVTLRSAAGGGLEISCQGVTSRLPGMDLEEYPQLPPPPPAMGEVPAESFARAVTRVCAVASTDQTLPLLTNVSLQLGQRLKLSATDRYRLATDQADWTPAPGRSTRTTVILVPAKITADFARKPDGPVTIRYQPASGNLGGFAGFSDSSRDLVLRTFDGAFPHPSGLPRRADPHTTVTISGPALAAALKRAAAATERAAPVLLDIPPAPGCAVTVLPVRDGQPAGGEDLTATITGPGDAVIGFNPAYLASLITGITGPARITITVTSGRDNGSPSYRPVKITAAAPADRFAAWLAPTPSQADHWKTLARATPARPLQPSGPR